MLVEELRLCAKNNVAYYIFSDTQQKKLVVHNAEFVRSLVAEGNLGVYNSIDEQGNITVSTKQLGNTNDLKTAQKHVYYETSLSVGWLAVGVPCMSAVCILKNNENEQDYVWCKMFTNGKNARKMIQFIEMLLQVLPKKYTEQAVITDMDAFITTEDESYVYSSCVLINAEVLRYICTEEGKQFLTENACLNNQDFLIDVSNLKTFDYVHTKRKREKPKADYVNMFITEMQAHNTEVLTKYKKNKVR